MLALFSVLKHVFGFGFVPFYFFFFFLFPQGPSQPLFLHFFNHYNSIAHDVGSVWLECLWQEDLRPGKGIRKLKHQYLGCSVTIHGPVTQANKFYYHCNNFALAHSKLFSLDSAEYNRTLCWVGNSRDKAEGCQRLVTGSDISDIHIKLWRKQDLMLSENIARHNCRVTCSESLSPSSTCPLCSISSTFGPAMCLLHGRQLWWCSMRVNENSNAAIVSTRNRSNLV